MDSDSGRTAARSSRVEHFRLAIGRMVNNMRNLPPGLPGYKYPRWNDLVHFATRIFDEPVRKYNLSLLDLFGIVVDSCSSTYGLTSVDIEKLREVLIGQFTANGLNKDVTVVCGDIKTGLEGISEARFRWQFVMDTLAAGADDKDQCILALNKVFLNTVDEFLGAERIPVIQLEDDDDDEVRVLPQGNQEPVLDGLEPQEPVNQEPEVQQYEQEPALQEQEFPEPHQQQPVHLDLEQQASKYQHKAVQCEPQLEDPEEQMAEPQEPMLQEPRPKRGRPPKKAPKKGVGRPKKTVPPGAEKPKRDVGAPKRGVGRPKNIVPPGAEKPKKSVGRPKKPVLPNVDEDSDAEN